MKLVDISWHPTDRQLRQFSVICLFALPLLGWFWGVRPQIVPWLVLVGLVLAIAGLTMPRVVKPIYLALTIVATPIGMVIGELALLLVYFGVFLPMGLVFRLIGRDALLLKADRTATTYWQPKKQPRGVASYFHQS